MNEGGKRTWQHVVTMWNVRDLGYHGCLWSYSSGMKNYFYKSKWWNDLEWHDSEGMLEGVIQRFISG